MRIDQKQERREFLERVGDSIIESALEFAEDPDQSDLRIQLLLYLMATGRLDIRFVYPRHVERAGLYHEKYGIFRFPWGEIVAFTGSANETRSGHHHNYESLDVFRSWVEADLDRIRIKRDQFNEMWSGDSRGVDILPPSPAVLERVETLAPAKRPTVEDCDGTEEDETNQIAGGASGSKDKWRHQGEAVEAFLEEKAGILEMATGTGKTRTALKIMDRLTRSDEIDTIIVSTDGTDLLDQWAEKLLWFIRESDRPFTLYRHYSGNHESELFVNDAYESILLTSRLPLANALKGITTKFLRRSLLVHDEVQGLGSPVRREELSGLAGSIEYRLGLSATPERAYDEEGTQFIEDHIGPVIYEFTLADAIERGILAPFDYIPLRYEPTQEDKERLKKVFSRKAAREQEGDPMSDKELAIALARVHKTSEAKIPLFEDFLEDHPEVLKRCIIFVETKEYGRKVLDVLHRHRYDFHTYFAEADKRVLERFAAGELECLITCHRLSEGIDIQNLRNIVLFASPKSRLETIQRIGRSLRRDPSDPEKRATVVDFIRVEEGVDEEDRTPGEERAAWLEELSQVEPQVQLN